MEDYRRLSSLIDNMLFIARAESPEQIIEKEKLNFRIVATEIIEYLEPLLAEKDLQVDVIGAGDLLVDAQLFKRAVINLITNAIKFSKQSQVIELVYSGTADFSEVTVSDAGAGVCSEDLLHVFDRFYKAKSNATLNDAGSGIGLAIVRSIMNLHEGRVEFNSKLDQGTSVRLCFPFQS